MFCIYYIDNEGIKQTNLMWHKNIEGWTAITNYAFKFAKEHPDFIVSIIDNDTGAILVDFQ